MSTIVVDGPVCAGDGWEGHGEIYVSEDHAEDHGHLLMAEARENVQSECSAQLAQRQGLPTMAASALVQSRWQLVELFAQQAVKIIEANGLQSEDRTELYAAFGRSCMQGAEVLFFGGKDGGRVHWQPNRDSDAQQIEPVFE